MERISKEAEVAQSRYDPRIWLEELANTMKVSSVPHEDLQEHIPNSGP